MREINIPPFLEFERLYSVQRLWKICVHGWKYGKIERYENYSQNGSWKRKTVLATEKREALNVKVKVKVQSFEDERIGHETGEPVEIVHIYIDRVLGSWHFMTTWKLKNVKR